MGVRFFPFSVQFNKSVKGSSRKCLVLTRFNRKFINNLKLETSVVERVSITERE